MNASGTGGPAARGGLLARWLVFAAGMFAAACGIAVITRSDLGATPLTSVPLTADAIRPLTLGTYMFFMNIVYLLLQKALLGPAFRMSAFWQLAPVAFFSVSVDFWMRATDFLPAWPYPARLCSLLVGTLVMAGGTLAEVESRILVLPGDGLLLALARRSGRSLGPVKVFLDVSMVAAAALLGLAFLGAVVGVGEGTVISAVLTGVFLRWLEALARRTGVLKRTAGGPGS